jgi:hypothetical protein
MLYICYVLFIKTTYGGGIYLNFTGNLADKDVFNNDIFLSLEVLLL